MLFTTQRLSVQQFNQLNVISAGDIIFQLEKHKREVEWSQRKLRKDELRKQVHDNAARIEKLGAKIKSLKHEIKNIKDTQLEYYSAKLREGTDVRQEGLIWVIKAIWCLGFSVPVSKMPQFLDKQAIEFLFKAFRRFHPSR